MKKKVQNYLHELIKSLSQTEKRYFKLLAKQQTPGKKNDCIKLFEEIDKQDVFNEEAIKAKFKGTPIEKRFASLKKYLYELVIKSLTFYNSDTLPSVRVRRIIDAVEILQTKGLYHQALRKLNKAEELSNEIGLLGSTQEIKRLKLHCLAKMNKFPSIDELAELKKEQEKLSLSIQLNNEIYNNNLDMLALSNEKQASSIVIEPKNELSLKDIKQKIELKYNKLLYYNSLINYHNLVKDTHNAEKFIDKMIALFNDNGLQIKLLPTKYIRSLFHKIDYIKNRNNQVEIKLFLKRCNEFFNDISISYYRKNADYAHLLNIEQEIFLRQNDLGNMHKHIRKVEYFLFNKRNKLAPSLHNNLVLNLAWAQLKCGKKGSVIKSIKNLTPYHYDENENKKILCASKLLIAILRFESNNYDLFVLALDDIKNSLYEKHHLNDLEKEVFKSLKNTLKSFGDKNLEQINFSKLYDSINNLATKEITIFDFLITNWIKEKANIYSQAILN